MSEDLGKLVLRLTVGVLTLLHGINKVINGIGPIEGLVQKAGMPGWVAFGAYIGEVVGPLMIIAGFYARIGGLIVVINMLFAIFLAHRTQLADLTPQGGWALELQGFFLLTALVVALIGPGRFSLNRR